MDHPLEIIKKYRHEVVKIDGKWFKPKKNSLDIPPNQFLSSNTTEFSSTAEGYFHPADLSDDVLKQPVLKFFQPIQLGKEYIVIGEVRTSITCLPMLF
jgi:hypothetical protein